MLYSTFPRNRSEVEVVDYGVLFAHGVRGWIGRFQAECKADQLSIAMEKDRVPFPRTYTHRESYVMN